MKPHLMLMLIGVTAGPCAAQWSAYGVNAAGDLFAIEVPGGQRAFVGGTSLSIVTLGVYHGSLLAYTTDDRMHMIDPRTAAIIDSQPVQGVPPGYRVRAIQSTTVGVFNDGVWSILADPAGDEWLYRLAPSTATFSIVDGPLNVRGITAMGHRVLLSDGRIFEFVHFSTRDLIQVAALDPNGGPYVGIGVICPLNFVIGASFWEGRTFLQLVHGSGYEDLTAVASMNAVEYLDCECCTGFGRLDIFDFLCFGNLHLAGDPWACNCDVSTGPNVCDIFDFLCFGNGFAASVCR